VLFIVFMSWSAGLRLLRARMAADTMDLTELESYVNSHHVPVIGGTAIFLTGGAKLPMALGEYLRKGGNLRDHTVHAAFLVQQVPTVPAEQQLTFVELGPHLTRVEIRYGFMEAPSGRALVEALRAHGIPVDEGNSMIIVHSVDPMPVDSAGMALWRKHIFAFLMRNARQPQLVLTVPQGMIMEWTTLMRF
jgi:KUP system potassium uptake protein